jgi:hypothetical protein
MMDNIEPSNSEKGRSFEKEVALLYEALGYKVDRNIQIDHHQIDILVTKYISGAHLMTYMVEAKYRTDPVGINEITAFSNTARDLLDEGKINGAIMVTNLDYTQNARGRFLHNKRVKILTIIELRNEIFNPSEALVRTIYDYERKSINFEYIPLRGTTTGNVKASVKDVAGYVASWVDSRRGLLLVSGDFGSGKTTVMERAFYECSMKYSKGESDLFPILLPLRSFLSYDDLWQFVGAKLVEKNYISVSRSTIESRLKESKVAIFLDGFDEIHTGASPKERAYYLSTLEPLINSLCPCVISTRPTYFESFDEMYRSLSRRLPGNPSFDGETFNSIDIDAVLDRMDIHRVRKIHKTDLLNILHIDMLDDTKILEYLSIFEDDLRKHTKKDTKFILQYLYKIYDLKDLLRRPLLLNMMVAIIVAGELNITDDSKSVGPSELYKAYTWISAKRDTKKGSPEEKSIQLLTEAERLENCREIAMEMLQKGSIELTNAEIHNSIAASSPKKIASLRGADRASMLDRIATDTRVCSFISNSDDGTFRFTHKSFFEFFVAQSIIMHLSKFQNFPASTVLKNITREILIFLGSFVRDNSDYAKSIETFFRSKQVSQEGKACLARICWASGTLLETLQIAATEIFDVELRRFESKRAYMNNVKFSRVDAEDITANEWQVVGAKISASGFRKCTFIRAKMDWDISETNIEQCSFEASTMVLNGHRSSNIDNIHVRGGSFAIRGGGHYRNGLFTSVADMQLYGDPKELTIDGSTRFVKSRVRGAEFKKWYGPGSKFTFANCVILGLYIEFADVSNLAAQNYPKNRPRVEFDDCTGVIFTNDPDGKVLSSDGLDLLKQRFPNLYFTDVTTYTKATTVDPLNGGQYSEAELATRFLDGIRQFIQVRPIFGDLGNSSLGKVMRTSPTRRT